MSRSYLAIAALCAVGAATLAATSAPAAASGPGMLPEQVIAARQASFRLSAAALTGMKGVVDSGGDVKTQLFAARAVASWARVLPTTFPAGTGMGQSGAKTAARPEIWSNRADFEAKAAAYAEAADKLVDLAQAGDRPGFSTQLDVIRSTCSACHDAYRAK